MIEEPIDKFFKDYYIPEIEKLSFHFGTCPDSRKYEYEVTIKYAMNPRQMYVLYDLS